jgi:protein lifeguard
MSWCFCGIDFLLQIKVGHGSSNDPVRNPSARGGGAKAPRCAPFRPVAGKVARKGDAAGQSRTRCLLPPPPSGRVRDCAMSSSKLAMGSSALPSSAAEQAAEAEAELLRKTYASTDVEGGYRDVATCAPEVRLGFLRKVFGILGAQLGLTVLICAFFMLVTPVRNVVLAANGVLSMLSILATFGTLFGLMACKDSFPLNMHLLAAFTVAESVMVGTLCAQYAAAGLGYLVLEALVITLAIFSGLTAYCIVSKKDFSFMGGALSAALFALIGASFINLIVGFTGGKSAGLAFLVSWGGAVLFSLYILYDVSMLMHKLSPDDYIIASIMLYLDILNLFLHVLSILSQNRD